MIRRLTWRQEDLEQIFGLTQTQPDRSSHRRELSLLAWIQKRWLLGTHQGAAQPEYLDYYPDEFTVRFNRRTSASRGKLFYRLVQQAVAVDPVTYRDLVRHARRPTHYM